MLPRRIVQPEVAILEEWEKTMDGALSAYGSSRGHIVDPVLLPVDGSCAHVG